MPLIFFCPVEQSGYLLLEDGSFILMETGDKILMESGGSKKISEMTQISALTGSELFPIVDEASTRSATIDLAMPILSVVSAKTQRAFLANSRALDVVYQNTTNRPISVMVCVVSYVGAGGAKFICDENPAPTTITNSLTVAPAGAYAATIHGLVPPNHYYKVQSVGSVSVYENIWAESPFMCF